MAGKSKNSDASFLMQGSILAIASIISRIVGLIYRVPLTAIIGKTGNDFYGTAYEIYNIILLISSYSIPLAVSKLVSAKMAKGHVKDAYKVLKGALIFAVISGGCAALIVYFGADFFTGTLLKTPLSSLALKVLAPTLFIVAILGVFRGFFQGLHTMIPSAISQILEQIVNAIISIVAAYYLFSYGKKVGEVLGDSQSYAAAYGASGGTLGTACGAAFGLLFILFIYFVFSKSFKKRVKKDRHRNETHYSEIMVLLIMTIIPVLLSTTVYNISGIIDQGIFKNIANVQGYTANEISEWWGVFAGQYKVLINVPISIASAIAASSVPALTAAFNADKHKTVNYQINLSTRFIMIIAFPCAIGMAVLAQPIMMLLFNDAEKTSGYMLMVGAVSIIFYSLSTLSNGLLQGIDRLAVPIKNAIISLVLHIILLVILLQVFHLNIYAVIIANAFYGLCMCILNQRSIYKYSGASLNFFNTFVMPLVSSVIMGACVFLSYKAFMLITNVNAISTLLSIILAVFVYAFVLIYTGTITKKELQRLPHGRILIVIGEKMHLM